MFFAFFRFVDSNGEFIIEVRLSKASTFFETDLLVTADEANDCHDYDAMEVNIEIFPSYTHLFIN